MVEAENREVARTALEQVCARGDMTLAPRCQSLGTDRVQSWAPDPVVGDHDQPPARPTHRRGLERVRRQ